MRTIIRVLGPSNQGMLNFYPLWAETIFSIVFLFVIWGMIILTSLISDVISIAPVSIFVPHLQQKLLHHRTLLQQPSYIPANIWSLHEKSPPSLKKPAEYLL